MKKIPMRMCVACREMRTKRELMRIVKTADGSLSLDLSGKLNGRGAYLCRAESCLLRAVKTRAFERALEAPLSEPVIEALRAEILKNGPAV